MSEARESEEVVLAPPVFGGSLTHLPCLSESLHPFSGALSYTFLSSDLWKEFNFIAVCHAVRLPNQ